MERQAVLNKEMMASFMATIREEAATTAAAAATAATATAEATAPEKKHVSKLYENKIDPKNLNRVNKFEGGDGYKEWALDILVTVETMCPGFREMLNEYMKDPETPPDYFRIATLTGKSMLTLACLRSRQAARKNGSAA